MPRDKTKYVRVPLEEGILTSEDFYKIGPRLREAQNYIYKYSPSYTGQPFSFNDSWEPLQVQTSGAVTLASCAIVTAGELFENQGADSGVGGSHLFGGRRTDNLLGIWNDGGTEISAGTLPNNVADYFSLVNWSTLPTDTTFISSPNIGTMQQTTDRATLAAYTPTGSFVGAARCLFVHQNRLWLAQNNLVYYTNVLDPTVVRSGAFYQFPMTVLGISRASVSDVDPGAQSHLIFFGASQIWVLDGAPNQGNDITRRLSGTVGCGGRTNFVQTDSGVVFFGSDNQLYLIPPGALELVPIGGPIRDRLIFVSGQKVVLGYRRPYLLAYLNSTNAYYTLDLSVDTGLPPKWWGPHVIGSIDEQYPQAISSRHPEGFVKFVGKDSLTSSVKIFLLNETTAIGHTQILKTGAFFESGFEVCLDRVVLDVQQGLVAKQYTVGVIDVAGGISSSSVTSAIGTGFQKLVVVPNIRTRGDFFRLQILCAGRTLASGDLGMAGIKNFEVQYRVMQRQD